MKVNNYSDLGLAKIKDMSVFELRKALFDLDMDVDIFGEGIQKTVIVRGGETETKNKAELLYGELMFRARGDNYLFFKWITEPPKEEDEKVTPVVTHPIPDTKPQCVHTYHSTNKFIFGGGFEVPYNINKGEAYDDHGNIIASIKVDSYRNRGYAVPALYSKAKAALRKKLIANGNHDAALHL